MGQEPQCILTMPLLEGLDGVEKLSKSKNNYIAVMDSANEMFGKTMSISDDLMWRWFALVSFRSPDEVASFRREVAGGRNPRDIKVMLAQKLVTRFHSRSSAEHALDEFNARSRGALPEDMPEITVKSSAPAIGVAQAFKQAGLVESTSEAFRLMEAGGLKIDGDRVSDRQLSFASGAKFVAQAGKRRFARITIE